MDTNDKIKIVVVGVVLILVIFIIYRIMGKVGLVKTAEAEAKEQAVTNFTTSEFFNPLFYKGKAFKPLGFNLAEQYAKDLKSAIRGIGTDEEVIYTTFAKLNNKTNISELAEAYYRLRERDLQADILNEMREKEVQKLMSIIDKLPEY